MLPKGGEIGFGSIGYRGGLDEGLVAALGSEGRIFFHGLEEH